MVSAKPLPSRALAPDDGLLGLLRDVGVSLANLGLRAANSTALEGPDGLSFCPHKMRELAEILERGRLGIARRIADKGGNPAALERDPRQGSHPPMNISEPVAFMIEYRDCCRRICKALNRSLEVPDAATGAMLSELALRLEKQLWLMDSSPHHHGLEPCRCVSLFLTC